MTGERQEATSFEDVREDHLRRYDWAHNQLPEEGEILDAFCGVGYGSALLAMRGPHRTILGIDGSAEAIKTARKHFTPSPAVTFDEFNWPLDPLPLQTFDGVVSIESLEHVTQPLKLFTHLAQTLEIGGVFVYSTPNGDELIKTRDTFPHHSQHWAAEYTLELANATIEDAHRHHNVQLELLDWAGQDVYETVGGRVTGLLMPEQMDVKPQTVGQFTLVACRRIS